MNVDLLPPDGRNPNEGSYPCAGCSSFRSAVGFYDGACVMLGKPRSPDQRSLYIGRIEIVRPKNGAAIVRRVDGLAGHCFSSAVESNAPNECIDRSVFRYGPVTRTETAKIGQKTSFPT